MGVVIVMQSWELEMADAEATVMQIGAISHQAEFITSKEVAKPATETSD